MSIRNSKREKDYDERKNKEFSRKNEEIWVRAGEIDEKEYGKERLNVAAWEVICN